MTWLLESHWLWALASFVLGFALTALPRVRRYAVRPDKAVPIEEKAVPIAQSEEVVEPAAETPPLQVAVVGGQSQLARALYPLVAAAGHVPIALVRDMSARDELRSLGARVRRLDKDAGPVDFVAKFTGCDAVVFAVGAGAGGNVGRKRSVDQEGLLKAIAAAKELGIRRFIHVSSIRADDPLPADTDADAELRASGLDWTVVRPGRLTDAAGTGLVDLGPEVGHAEIPRADAAAVIVAVLTDDSSIGQEFNVVSGSTPIAQAVAAASPAP